MRKKEKEEFSPLNHTKKKKHYRRINFINLPRRMKEDCDHSYSYWNLFFHYVVSFAVIGAVCFIYQLHLPCFITLCILELLGAPALIYYKQKRQFEATLFGHTVQYVENMTEAFRRKPKILSALTETNMVVTEGRLHNAIEESIEDIRNGNADVDDIYRSALNAVEKVVPDCQRVQNLHEFLSEVELVGGSHETALDIMQEDLRDWDVRTSQFIAEQNIKKASILGSIIMSLGVCLFMNNLMPHDLGGDISNYVLYQVVTTAMMAICYLFYRFISKKITHSWVSDAKGYDPKTVQKDLDTVHAYLEAQKNGKRALRPVLAMTRIRTELESKYPRWVLRFALLTTSQSVISSLQASVAHAPLVMQAELQKLLAGIDEKPRSIEPYLSFFDYLKVPTIRSMMLMIYSLSEYSTQDMDKHVLSICKRNYALTANAEKNAAEDQFAAYSLWVTIPMVLACIVLIVNVMLLVANMMNMIMGFMQF